MRHWQGRGFRAWLLVPVSLVFYLLTALRRLAYRHGFQRSIRVPVPVVVVGNLVAGGAGKTPLVIWLAERLERLGRRPGVVSRGYGRMTKGVLAVSDQTTADEVGDEPLLIYRRTGRPVFVGNDRAQAAKALLAKHPECDLILCDDGLQHYRLQRDVEICVIDRRGFFNGWLLPAGPLREPLRRLDRVDAVVCHDCPPLPPLRAPVFTMRLMGERFYRLDAPGQTAQASELAPKRLAAIAGIAEPQRFFDHLRTLGLEFSAYAFPDHHRFEASDLTVPADALLMTEKDAIKCQGLVSTPIWVLPVCAEIAPDLASFVLEKIDGPTPSGNPRLPAVQGAA
ncbi:MAG: tetraacyldisaccharide 4'-kinase [Rhodocyclaceae bacterium]|nr:tetraacyldisaccharide 4'-kinase [Rhodocyclaceae bacterium]